MTDILLDAKLTKDEMRILELLREGFSFRWADIDIKIQDGKLVAASVSKKIKF